MFSWFSSDSQITSLRFINGIQWYLDKIAILSKNSDIIRIITNDKKLDNAIVRDVTNIILQNGNNCPITI